ncbi:type II toxin-antitoxin system HicB family antitoxin [Geitlerinema sp. P-1104]|uniref:type II toxin-antitoxin system HicB family antitoxin n=1 Tax=Geitlerinema sp. P-1104 TaxID=2546230 RepID=UPI001476D9CD|nr:type II toxin-antitoxin system HicB family antitoxin [Geitlerinema sp. P-1104]NMG57178.1 type II toxin-antitoxin system HicB family antitoxin [Geitlerinema sp. P-1104]
MNNLKYRIMVQWSDDDNCFLVGFPDFPGQEWRTHGETYEEALRNGTEALESLVMAYQSMGEPLPEPQTLPMIS